MRHVYFIGENLGLLRNLEAIFLVDSWNIIYITSQKPIKNKSENYLHIETSKDKRFIEELLRKSELLESINGLVIFGSDHEMREVSISNCPIWIKKKLLPTKNEIGFSILDSKVGLTRILMELNIKSPRQYIFDSMIDIEMLEISKELPWLMKGDSGGGGSKVLDISNIDLEIPSQKNIGFPFVLQEKILGEEIYVEAFYWEGILTGYIYNKDVRNISTYGPSYSRLVAAPGNLDFLNSLVTLGKNLEISGLVNCTFILESNSNEHYLVEFDPRPNVWHHLAKYLEFDLPQLFEIGKYNFVQTPARFAQVFSLDRYINFLERNLEIKNILRLLRIIFSNSIYVLEFPNDSILYKFKFVAIKFARISCFNLMKNLFRKMPRSFQDLIKRRGYTLSLSQFILRN